MQKFIERYKSLRKKKFLELPSGYAHQYAFIGAGQHSISNLYPVIHHLGIPLKKICTLHPANAVRMAERFPSCTGTGNLQQVLEDDSIKGVFLSASPSSHFSLTQQLLKAGKHVFVEKPPCHSVQELQLLLQVQGTRYCMPGLQKRFSTVNRLLAPYCKRANTYTYRYLTGAYPEGNALYDLFIHPVDNLVQLFGAITSVQFQRSANNLTWFVTCQHTNGASGLLHLSTDHSWNSPVDELEVNTDKAIFNAAYPFRLVSTGKSATILNIPLEKVFKTPVTQKIYLNNTGFIPTDTNNSISLQGFVGEIEYFVRATEQGKWEDRFNLASLLPTYAILEQLNQSANH